MTSMLASVSSLQEAMLALDAQADIIDLKQPALGSLGALDVQVVEQICNVCRQQRPVSATIGDLPMQPELIADAVKKMAGTGVDYIKIGFFPGGDWPGTVNILSTLRQNNPALVAVLFADTEPGLEWVDVLQKSGFRGVMLDTMDKTKGGLTELMSPEKIKAFVAQAKSRQMLCGLAGSLRLQDIPALTRYHPDYLGFRGALCRRQERTSTLDRHSMIAIKHAIEKAESKNRGI